MGTVDDVDALDTEAVDSVLREIERLKIEVSAAEADQAQLLSAFKAQDEATRETKQRCDQLLRRQRQLQQLEEALVQREITAMGRVIPTPGSNLIRQASLQAPALPG